MFVGFLYGVRADAIARRAAVAFPSAWNTTLFPAPTYPDRTSHRPMLDVDRIRSELRTRSPVTQTGVVFVVDIRPTDVLRLQQDLVYTLPRLEVVGIPSWNLEASLAEYLAYYRLVDTSRPRDLAEALQMFSVRHPNVTVLSRAIRSAVDAAAFREPRLVLTSLHWLPRVYIDWYDARRRDHKRSSHRDLKDLQHPAREALRQLIQDARFDLSDDDSAAQRHWECPDETRRYFGWHLKWSLGAQRGIQNHCRVYYAFDRGEGTASSQVFLGHCGEHL